jgi:hypothetical protein
VTEPTLLLFGSFLAILVVYLIVSAAAHRFQIRNIATPGSSKVLPRMLTSCWFINLGNPSHVSSAEEVSPFSPASLRMTSPSRLTGAIDQGGGCMHGSIWYSIAAAAVELLRQARAHVSTELWARLPTWSSKLIEPSFYLAKSSTQTGVKRIIYWSNWILHDRYCIHFLLEHPIAFKSTVGDPHVTDSAPCGKSHLSIINLLLNLQRRFLGFCNRGGQAKK